MQQLTTPAGPIDPRIAAIISCALVQRLPAPEHVIESLERMASTMNDPDYRMAAAFVRDALVIRGSIDRVFNGATAADAVRDAA